MPFRCPCPNTSRTSGACQAHWWHPSVVKHSSIILEAHTRNTNTFTLDLSGATAIYRALHRGSKQGSQTGSNSSRSKCVLLPTHPAPHQLLCTTRLPHLSFTPLVCFRVSIALFPCHHKSRWRAPSATLSALGAFLSTGFPLASHSGSRILLTAVPTLMAHLGCQWHDAQTVRPSL